MIRMQEGAGLTLVPQKEKEGNRNLGIFRGWMDQTVFVEIRQDKEMS